MHLRDGFDGTEREQAENETQFAGHLLSTFDPDHPAPFLHRLADDQELKAVCYFIGGDEGPVKIGYATNPNARLQELRCASWIELRILATAPGGIYRERAYHAQFDDHRIRGEWFKRVPEIEAEIDRLAQIEMS